MNISNSSSSKKSPTKLSRIFNISTSIFISIIGLAFLIQSVIGGILIILSGLIFSFPIKNQILEKLNVKLITTRFINFLSIFLFVFGSFYAMNESDSKNKAIDWEKNNVQILMKISQQLEDGNLSGANFDLKKYESVAKNDPTFLELKANYQKLYSAQETKKKSSDSKQGGLSEQDRTIAERLKLGARCAGFYSKWGPGSIENCKLAASAEPFSKVFIDNMVQCDAFQSQSWYETFFNSKSESGTFSTLAEYLKANKAIYEEEYRIGVSKNQGSNMDLDTSGKCRDYMSTTREAFSKQR